MKAVKYFNYYYISLAIIVIIIIRFVMIVIIISIASKSCLHYLIRTPNEFGPLEQQLKVFKLFILTIVLRWPTENN